MIVLGEGWEEEESEPRHVGSSAAIVDQVSLTIPNATFVDEATQFLENAGFAVDYYPGEEVTVEFYKRLPRFGYDILILRTHMTAGPNEQEEIVLFTSDPYASNRYNRERRAGALAIVDYYDQSDDLESYFGVRPKFFLNMRGDFEGALVVAMGCEGLSNPSMAQAFLAKGASAYVGWDTTVTSDRTDTATLVFLRERLHGTSLTKAIQATMETVGEDTVYGSVLNAVGERQAMM